MSGTRSAVRGPQGSTQAPSATGDETRPRQRNRSNTQLIHHCSYSNRPVRYRNPSRNGAQRQVGRAARGASHERLPRGPGRRAAPGRTVCVARFGRTEMTSSISSYSSPAGSAQLLGCPDAEDRCVCAGTDKRVLDHYHDGGDDGEDPRPEPALPGFRCIRWDGGYALPAPLILMNGSPLLTSEL
jgi:hypothetical protein